MNETAIAWTNLTWNPASGCEKVSAGCRFCYAEFLAEQKRGTKAFPNGFDLTIRPHKLTEPYKVKTPSLIFVNSMSDFGWPKIPDSYRDQIVDVIEATPWHQYQVLTKRPEEVLRYSKRRKLPGNFWAGVTIESGKTAGRLDILKEIDAEIRFVSGEPLLDDMAPALDLHGISWLISGGESGRHLSDPKTAQARALAFHDGKKWVARPDRIQWVRNLRDACQDAGAKFFHKQWGGYFPHSAGRDLDGRTWDEYPRLPAPTREAAAPAPGRLL